MSAISTSPSHSLPQHIPVGSVSPRESNCRSRSILDLADVRAGLNDVRGLYVHIPFCFHKCHYCDFYSIVDRQDRQEAFVDRLLGEIAWIGGRLSRPLETIFFGGGTPTLLRTPLWRQLLSSLRDCLPIGSCAEITVESNPETVTEGLASVLAAGGVNRVSIGAQSFNPRLLKALERWHEPANVARSEEIYRRAGIININLDLIFAIPGQTLADWRGDLEQALSLEPAHMSCYGLTYEPNTPMTARLRRGEFARAENELEAAMYELTRAHLAAAGFEHYEISNWARTGRPCEHNMLYWRGASWWPIGPGAAGHVNGVRWKNAPRLAAYLESEVDAPPIIDVERLESDGRIGEALMLRLRLREGLPLDELDAMLEMAGESRDRRREAIDLHIASGLLERTRGALRLTDQGLLLADFVLSDLI